MSQQAGFFDETYAGGEGGFPALRGLSLELREGDVLGVAGVAGNG